MIRADGTSLLGNLPGTGKGGLRGRAGVIVLVLVVLVLLLAVAAIFSRGRSAGPLRALTSGKATTPVELKTEYRNPFERDTQYVNPFEEQKSPFGSLQQ